MNTISQHLFSLLDLINPAYHRFVVCIVVVGVAVLLGVVFRPAIAAMK
jgi:hypothetical protein